MRLARFYGWPLAEIKRMSMREVDEAVKFMAEEQKREAGSHGK